MSPAKVAGYTGRLNIHTCWEKYRRSRKKGILKDCYLADLNIIPYIYMLKVSLYMIILKAILPPPTHSTLIKHEEN